jgi:hypothetical protein
MGPQGQQGPAGPTGATGGTGTYQTGPGLTINSGTTPPTIDVITPYLALSGGTVTGNLSVNGGAVIGQTATPTAHALLINDTATQPQSGVLGAGVLTIASETHNPAVILDAYGTAITPGFGYRRARGTAAAPTALQQFDNIGMLNATGYTGSAYVSASPLIVQTTQNWATGVAGYEIVFQTIPASTSTSVNSLILNGNAATFVGTVNTGATITAGGGGRVISTGTQPTVSVYSTGTPAVAAGMWIGNGTDATLYFGQVDGNGNPTAVEMQVLSGNLTIQGATATKPGGGSWVAPSSAALKTDIAPWSEGLAAVLALDPVSYRYTGEHGLPTDQSHIGLIHEDVTLDELKGTATLGETEVDTIDSGPLIYALVNAVKELSARLAALEGAR